MRSVFLLPTFLCISAGPAIAQEIQYLGAELSYDTIRDDSLELDNFGLNGELEVLFNGVFLGANYDSNTLSDGGDEFTISTYGIAAGYVPMPGALIGAGLTGFTLDDGSSESYNGYEFFAQYQTDQFGGALRYDKPVPDEADFYFVQIFGEARVTPQFTVGGIVEMPQDTGFDADPLFYMNAEYAEGPIWVRGYYADINETDVNAIGLRGTYEFGGNFRGSAAFQTLGDGTDSYEAYSIGGGYMVADGVWIDASFGQISDDSESADTMGIALTYEMGSQTRLDRRMINAARTDLSEGYLSVIPSLPFGVGGFLD